MERVYAFTNENLSSFNNIYDFTNAKVLSVLGSGDQYFASMLYGAKEVDLYDKNINTWNYFLFKLNAIKYFSYGQFYDTFILFNEFCDAEYERTKKSLSAEAYATIEYLKQQCGDLHALLKYDDMPYLRYSKGINIPYLDYDEYLKLQHILKNKDIPKFYHCDLEDLPKIVENKPYDLFIASNILQWLGCQSEEEVIKYTKLFDSLNCQNYQALYTWGIREETRDMYLNQGYTINEVATSKELKDYSDYVISRKRSK